MKSSRRLPFAAIATRPYDQALLTDVDWYEIKPVYIQCSSLILTQEKLTVKGLFGLERYSTDPHIRIVEWKGCLYVEDGHHRLIEQAIQRGFGQGVALGRVFVFGLVPYEAAP